MLDDWPTAVDAACVPVHSDRSSVYILSSCRDAHASSLLLCTLVLPLLRDQPCNRATAPTASTISSRNACTASRPLQRVPKHTCSALAGGSGTGPALRRVGLARAAALARALQQVAHRRDVAGLLDRHAIACRPSRGRVRQNQIGQGVPCSAVLCLDRVQQQQTRHGSSSSHEWRAGKGKKRSHVLHGVTKMTLAVKLTRLRAKSALPAAQHRPRPSMCTCLFIAGGMHCRKAG